MLNIQLFVVNMIRENCYVVSDETTVLMARDIVKRIEEEMEYPGQIKVNVIRELRSVDYAK